MLDMQIKFNIFFQFKIVIYFFKSSFYKKNFLGLSLKAIMKNNICKDFFQFQIQIKRFTMKGFDEFRAERIRKMI